jgi:hypothetical protein
MPGQRGNEERTLTVNVRLTPAEKAAWEKHVEKQGGYVGSLVRELVNEHIRDSGPKPTCRHWG